jgi:hypothetical protein
VTGKVLPSQGAIQFAANGRFLIAADAGSNRVSGRVTELAPARLNAHDQ